MSKIIIVQVLFHVSIPSIKSFEGGTPVLAKKQEGAFRMCAMLRLSFLG